MMGGLAIQGFWGWIVVGLVLMAAEVMAPGAFMVWLGVAAVVTGIVAAVLPLSFEWSALLFAVLALLAVLGGRLVHQRRAVTEGGAAFVDNRAQALVGRVFALDGPIENGIGRVRVDDTVWRVRGADAGSGTRVRVVGFEGSTLKVVPIDLA
jgi:membrane protein implicated in regulation of membrane protease activity